MLAFVSVEPSASITPPPLQGLGRLGMEVIEREPRLHMRPWRDRMAGAGLGMYRAGANDKTWMYTMTQPYPSMTAPGRWDTTPVVGFVPPYYGPNVPGCYLDPYLYGAETPVDYTGLALVAVAIAAGGFIGAYIARSAKR